MNIAVTTESISRRHHHSYTLSDADEPRINRHEAPLQFELSLPVYRFLRTNPVKIDTVGNQRNLFAIYPFKGNLFTLLLSHRRQVARLRVEQACHPAGNSNEEIG